MSKSFTCSVTLPRAAAVQQKARRTGGLTRRVSNMIHGCGHRIEQDHVIMDAVNEVVRK